MNVVQISPYSQTSDSVRRVVRGRGRSDSLSDSLSEDWSLLLQRVGTDQDRDAYAKLFSHFAPRMKSLMMRYGAGSELAEEITQEAFVIVWRKAAQFDPEKSAAATWLFTIVRNKRIDILRRQQRPEPDANDPAFMPDPPELSENLLAGKERANAVRKAIERLPNKQRDVLLRSYFSEETHREISDNLKLPLGTVKSRLRLALEKLKSEIENDLGEDSL